VIVHIGDRKGSAFGSLIVEQIILGWTVHRAFEEKLQNSSAAIVDAFIGNVTDVANVTNYGAIVKAIIDQNATGGDNGRSNEHLVPIEILYNFNMVERAEFKLPFVEHLEEFDEKWHL